MKNITAVAKAMEHFSEISEKNSNVQLIMHVVITIAFIIGALANLTVLWILHKSSKVRNSKHILMLRCLASNDIIAQCGMLLMLYLNKYDVLPTHWRCALFVCLRGFGIGSGCVALVMAVERWLALTKPFLYQAFVTHSVVKRCIFLLWGGAIIVTYFPLFGFGQYYNNGKCSRYREAMLCKDVIYAFIFFTFGTSIILGIVCCNVRILYELWKIRNTQRPLVRRCSKPEVTTRYSTEEEVSFAKLMAALCIVFITCWMPQMISIPLAQFWKESRLYKVLGKISDPLLVVYFALDPYVYVLQRYTRGNPCKMFLRSSRSSSGSRSISINGATQTSSIHLQSLTPILREKV
ncbi:prostaglandin D2 receptor [Photinus pyralis]|nr:prostaglandin D2 receptor [Photinus pyralis]